MQIKNHILTDARYIESPNFNDYPDPEKIDLLVIHCISLPPAQFGGEGITQLFTNTLNSEEHPYYAGLSGLKVSAHVLIRREGEILQFVPFNRRAWHAGESSFGGRENCNDFSIGIELEGTDTTEFTDAQYQSLAKVTRLLQKRYPAMTSERITGHSDIAPGRKTDPGIKFDWQKYRDLLQ